MSSTSSTTPPLSPIIEESLTSSNDSLPPLSDETTEKKSEEKSEEKKEVMVPVIDFNRYFDVVPKKDTDENNVENVFTLLEKEPETFMMSYPTSLNIVPNNMSNFLKDENGNLYIEISLAKNCDVASDFNINSDKVKLNIVLLDKVYDMVEDAKVLLVCCHFNTVIFRFTFTDEPTEFTFKYKSYLLQHNVRQEVLKTPALCSKNLLYKQGTVQWAEFVSVENVKEENKEEENKE